MSITNGLQLEAQEDDGKRVVTPYPATIGFKTWTTGAADQIGPPLVRGGGDKIKLSWTANEPRGAKSLDIQFGEPVEIHNGEGYYTPVEDWSMEDEMDFQAVFAATDAQASGSGNANLVSTPQGDIYVPAPGDGGFEIDLAAAVPVPVFDEQNPNGFWDVDHNTGTITPSATPGAAMFNLLPIELAIYFVRRITLGNPRGIFETKPYKVQWIHQRWKLRLTVNKQSAGAGNFAGWLQAFRRVLR